MIRRPLLVSLFLPAALGGTALAGAKYDQPGATIDQANMSASAYLGYTRNSADPIEAAGCSLNATDGGSRGVNCWVFDGKGRTATCFVSSSSSPHAANFVAAVSGLHSDGLIWFGYDRAGHCTWLHALSNSGFVPKLP